MCYFATYRVLRYFTGTVKTAFDTDYRDRQTLYLLCANEGGIICRKKMMLLGSSQSLVLVSSSHIGHIKTHPSLPAMPTFPGTGPNLKYNPVPTLQG